MISTSPSEIDRTEVATVEGMLTDGVGRAIPNRDLVLSVDGQEITSISVNSNGSFVGLVPIPPDMPLGPIIIGVEFLGEDFILPSNSTVVFTVFAPVSVTIDDIGPIAVGDEMTVPVPSRTISRTVGWTAIPSRSSWTGPHWHYKQSAGWQLEPAMGGPGICGNRKPLHFRDRTCSRILQKGSSESNFTVSYHTEISLQVEGSYATRGGYWNFSGRLFESDTGFEQGLEGREITVHLTAQM